MIISFGRTTPELSKINSGGFAQLANLPALFFLKASKHTKLHYILYVFICIQNVIIYQYCAAKYRDTHTYIHTYTHHPPPLDTTRTQHKHNFLSLCPTERQHCFGRSAARNKVLKLSSIGMSSLYKCDVQIYIQPLFFPPPQNPKLRTPNHSQRYKHV